MEKTVKDLNGPAIITQMKTWLLAASDLGQEIQDLTRLQHERSARIMSMRPSIGSGPNGWERVMAEIERTKKEADQMNNRFSYKCSLFLVALNKVARWGKKLKKAAPDKSKLVDNFLESFAGGKDIRDIHEHDDEYRTGGGKHPEKLHQTMMGGMIAIDAISTIEINGELFIGGQVSVQQMLRAVSTLQAGLSTAAAAPTSTEQQ